MESGNKQHRTLHLRRSQEMLVAEDVERMLALHKNGWDSKRIARELGVARNTVRRYLAAGGYVPYRSPVRRGKLAGREAWLRMQFHQHRGNCDVVRQELACQHQVLVSLRTVERACRGFRAVLAAQARATVRFETPPGKQLQIDFGSASVEIDGEKVRVHVFVATLGYSRLAHASPARGNRRGSQAWRRPSPTSAGCRRKCCSTTPSHW